MRGTHGLSAQPQPRRSRARPRFRSGALLSLLVVGCIFAAQSSGQVQEADNGQSNVHGTVINSVTHEPIGRALVSSSDNRFGTLTDGEGHFEFVFPAGSAGKLAWLMARKPGFLDDSNERRQVEASPGSELTISLIPEALIKGRVILSTGDAATGINVQIFTRQVQEGRARWVQGIRVRANSNGEFRFAELQAGDYKLLTHEFMDNDPAVSVPGGQLYGFPPVYYPNATDFAAASTIQLRAGQTFQADLSLVPHPYYPVRIPVTNAEANVGITVSSQGHRGPGYSLGYNRGRQRIEGSLPNGNYLVEASTFGQSPVSGMANLMVAGAPAEGPSLVLTRSGSMVANVKEEFTTTNEVASGSFSNGHRTFTLHGPRTYLQVSLETAEDFGSHGGGSLREPTGPNDDSLVIENVPPGRYWLRVNSSRGYVASATMGGVDLLHQPLVVGLGSSTPIEITMRDDSAEIDGTVAGITATGSGAPLVYTGKSGFPINSSAYVYCIPLPDSPGQFDQLGVSAEGKINPQTIAPGTYHVMAFKDRQTNLPYRDAEAMRAYDAKGQIVHLSPGQKATVQLQLIPSSE
jgi:hypothetical protein